MKRTGSVTTSENSPKMRGMTCSPVSGSITDAADADRSPRRMASVGTVEYAL